MTSENERLIVALQRSLNREKMARNQSETQLEKYSREIYESNLQLKEQTQEAQYKQKHLAFLTDLSDKTWQLKTQKELINNYLDKCSQFMNNSIACFFSINNVYAAEHIRVIKTALNEQHNLYKCFNNNYLAELLATLDLSEFKKTLCSIDSGQKMFLKNYLLNANSSLPELFTFALPIYRHGGDVGVVCFFYDQEHEVKKLKLQTINASYPTLSMALERKRAEQSLENKVVELEQAYKELQQIQQHLVESEKLASLGLLSAGIAHEINNPIGFITSNIDTMQDYINDFKTAFAPIQHTDVNALKQADEAVATLTALCELSQNLEVPFLLDDSEEILASTLSGLHRVTEIVADLRVFSRMDSHELVELDLHTVLTRSLHMLNNELKYQYTIITNLTPNCLILGNDGQLQQVFINILMNAKHSMEAGGRLTITCKHVEDKVVVTVEDQGHGIAEKDLKEIFTPFFTTKPPGQGTGLGLSISYSIIQQHNAQMTVESEVGKGTKFTLTFDRVV